MLLYLINPSNPLVSWTRSKENRFNRYRLWKPLGLLVVAGLTPPDWTITVVDENLGIPDYMKMARPDLVGITAFTSQVTRGYEIAAAFRGCGVPVVMGGIHATMRFEEVSERVDAVVTGEAESCWGQVLQDVRDGALKRIYAGVHVEGKGIPAARHELLPTGYRYGSIQTARGCPLDCSFCSVTAFNGRKYRRRPVEAVVRELAKIPEKEVLIVDDNLIGTREDHIAGAKELFRAMIKAKLHKRWIAQATINMADDEELLQLAAKAGCAGVFIGFESPSVEGLLEIHKKFNVQKGRDFRASVKRIQRHGIVVAGSFILGLDVDKPGIGREIADAASGYGLDLLNVQFLTPLPGTRLWDKMESEDRIDAKTFPEDWRFYTLTLPVARYKHLDRRGILREMDSCNRSFYSPSRILRRVGDSVRGGRKPVLTLAANLSNRNNFLMYRKIFKEFETLRGEAVLNAPPAAAAAAPMALVGTE